MAWYDRLLGTASKPFAGVGESFEDLNIFGASVPESFKQMNTAGLLGPGVYEAAIADADKKGKRDAIVQGLLSFGTQNFNKGVGSIFNPAYLAKPLGTAIESAQKPYDELSPNVMNLEKLKEFKRTSDRDKNVQKVLTDGLYKKTVGKDGKISFDVDYDIVDTLIQEGDVSTAKDISGILSSRAARLASMKDNYKIFQEGDTLYYAAKDGSGTYKATKKGLVPKDYEEKREDIIPDKGDLQAFNTQLHGKLSSENKKIDKAALIPITSGIYDIARRNYQNRSAEDADKTLVDFGYDALNNKYKESPPAWWFGSTSYDPKTSYSQENPFSGTAEQIKNSVKVGDYYINPNDNKVYKKLR
tara:strand:+ start:853 stop:1926 length:1074 start_codon:yes stop_codon:yes gene_type:complete